MNRVFVFGCIVAGSSALGLGGLPARTGPTASAGPPPKETLGGKALLTPADFTFVGSYPFSAENQATFGMGLTCRRVKGQLRFLTTAYSGDNTPSPLIEFALPDSIGQ